jgi:hypothetical protein
MARESRPPASRPDLGASSLPLADGRVALSSAPDAMVADRLTADTGIRLTFLVPRAKHSSIT